MLLDLGSAGQEEAIGRVLVAFRPHGKVKPSVLKNAFERAGVPRGNIPSSIRRGSTNLMVTPTGLRFLRQFGNVRPRVVGENGKVSRRWH